MPRSRMARWLVPLMLIFVFFDGGELTTQTDPYIHADRLGITHISLPGGTTPPDRYTQALTLGAGWNRWPIYWNRVQPEPGTWNWDAYDPQVVEDIRAGFKINAILLGRPEFYADEYRIQGMHTPIFADGTDLPEAGKTLNPENPWVHYVAATVERYRPNGTLVQQGDLLPGQGIRVWEVWNEPDHLGFWRGSIGDYARLLKSAYIVIKMVDPSAQVMFGGLLYGTEVNWLAQVLGIFSTDPMHEQFNWYVDIVAVHNYGDPWRTGWLVLFARQTLIAYEIERPIWVNETGVPAWDDYPGPVWEPTSEDRATTMQQAWFMIQSAAFAWSEGADKVFYHQLYDDCGDQPAGTDFPPHGGNLCQDSVLCLGDAFGIFRNTSDATCFSQHPLPATARPVARAYRLLADIFGTQPFTDGDRVYHDNRVVTLTFTRALSKEQITVFWNRTRQEVEFTLPAVGRNGQLYSLTESTVIVPDDDFNYMLTLPPALDDTDRTASPEGGSAIGGPPFILIERVDETIQPQPTSDILLPEIDVEIFETTPVPTLPPPRPTVNPALDTQPPKVYMQPLPETSEPVFTVSWIGNDDSGIAGYVVFVRVDGGDWTPWIDTTSDEAASMETITSAEYAGSPGTLVEFAVWAVDLADNWSTNVTLTPMASTQIIAG